MKMRFIPTSVHSAIDHVVGPALVIAPTVLRLRRTSPEGIVARAVGGAESVYSNLTDYELSVKNVVPMRLHLALDAVGGATLALVPQLTGARQRGKKHWVPHLAIGAFEVGMAVFTKTKPPQTTSARRAQIAKLVATAKVAKDTAVGVAKSVA
ncbi:MAG TPA: hypothetical protein VE220_03090 [Gaiellaceae bacterium]|jgi:hypothetical protein|nr:hypothetical protein [Gaiellaceae bacterium]